MTAADSNIRRLFRLPPLHCRYNTRKEKPCESMQVMPSSRAAAHTNHRHCPYWLRARNTFRSPFILETDRERQG
jgi:hypothetical protein